MVNLQVVARGARHSLVQEDVQAIRAESGLSLTEIAQALGVSKRSVQAWSQGVNQPDGWRHAHLLLMKRLAFHASLAMPFNTPDQRRMWWLTSSADHAPSPLQLLAHEPARVQSLIETAAIAFGRRLLQAPPRRRVA